MSDDQLYDIIGEIVIETGFQGMVRPIFAIMLEIPTQANDSVNVYGV